MSDCIGCAILKDSNHEEIQRVWKLVNELRTENRQLQDELIKTRTGAVTAMQQLTTELSPIEETITFNEDPRWAGLRMIQQQPFEIRIKENQSAEETP